MPYTSRTAVLTLSDSVVTARQQQQTGAFTFASPTDQVVTRLADGRIVIVWSGSLYGDNDVRFQILNSAGAPLTAPRSVFGVEDAAIRAVSVAALADGSFVIRGDGQLQRYAASGLPTGPVISVPTGAGGEVVALGQGFVVATIGAITTGGANYSINLDVYSAQGQLQSQQAIASIAGSSTVRDLQISVRQGADAASTRIVTVWSELPPRFQPSYQSVQVRVQVVDGDGRSIGATLQLGAFNDLINTQPDVAFLADGSFVVCWANGYESRGSGPFLTQIFSQHFSADGVALGSASAMAGSYAPSVTALADGGYLVTWDTVDSGYGQQFDAQGNKVGAQFQFGLADTNGAVLLNDGHVMVIGGLQFQILSPNINVEVGNNANNVYQGTAGDDTYNGVTGDDTIRGGAGNDLLRGDEGNDFLYGDAGNDILVGGVGFDTIDGGDGYDVLQLDKPLLSYFVEQTATGFRLWDGAEYDTVTNVEGVLQRRRPRLQHRGLPETVIQRPSLYRGLSGFGQRLRSQRSGRLSALHPVRAGRGAYGSVRRAQLSGRQLRLGRRIRL